MYVFTLDSLKNILAELIAVGGELAGAKLHLFSEDVFPSRQTLPAELTGISAGGMTAATAIVWGAIFVNGNQAAEVVGAPITFHPLSAVDLPITAFGYAITNTAGTALIVAERFATPFTFNGVDDQFAIVPRIVLNT